MEKSESLIAGFASAFTTTARLLEQYFTGGKFSVYDARSIGEACSLKGSSEDIERILYTYIKSGCDRAVVDRLASAVAHFFEVAERYVEFGDEYKSFDLPTIFDTLFSELIEEEMSLISRRVAKIEADRNWLRDSLKVIDINNNDKYEMDEIDDVEHENEFRVNRIFDNCDRIGRIAKHIADYREAHGLCWKYGLHSLVELGVTIEDRIERYSSELTPVEYVKEKYRQAVEAGEFIIGSDYELRDWECEDIQTKEEIDVMVSKSSEMESLPSERPSNNGLPKKEYFSWQKVNHIHDICNGNQFHEVTKGEMYSIINLHDCQQILAYRDGELERVCHLIHMLEKCMTKSEGRKWRTSICDHLKIKPHTYNKNYKKVSSVPSRFHEEFDNKISAMLKKFEDIDEAA